MDTATTAFIFPGQGSQAMGMGKSIYDAYGIARETFEEADEILGTALSQLMFNGPVEELNDTYNTQIALYVTSVALLRVVQSEQPAAVPAFAAGHSLGEFSALAAAGVFPFADGVRLVRERGRLMREAGETNPGSMGAFLGLDLDKAREICMSVRASSGEALVIANDNCPGQVVISGAEQAVEQALEQGKSAGAKRAVKLALSVAAHSPLMQAASDAFRVELDKVTFADPAYPIYGNVDATSLTKADEVRHELNRQMLAPVRWTESVQAMISDGAQTFVEIGSGEVLSGLVRRIDRKVARMVVQDAESLTQFLEKYQ